MGLKRAAKSFPLTASPHCARLTVRVLEHGRLLDESHVSFVLYQAPESKQRIESRCRDVKLKYNYTAGPIWPPGQNLMK